MNALSPICLAKTGRTFSRLSSMASKQAIRARGHSANPITSASTECLPKITQPKGQASTKIVSVSKRKQSILLPEPLLKHAASSVGLNPHEDPEVSHYESKSKNPVLGDSDQDQAAQSRQLPVNSDILPLPWRGRLGFAYEFPRRRLILVVSTPCYENLNLRYFAVERAEWIQFSAMPKKKERELSLQRTSADRMLQTWLVIVSLFKLLKNRST